MIKIKLSKFTKNIFQPVVHSNIKMHLENDLLIFDYLSAPSPTAGHWPLVTGLGWFNPSLNDLPHVSKHLHTRQRWPCSIPSPAHPPPPNHLSVASSRARVHAATVRATLVRSHEHIQRSTRLFYARTRSVRLRASNYEPLGTIKGSQHDSLNMQSGVQRTISRSSLRTLVDELLKNNAKAKDKAKCFFFGGGAF